MPRASWGGGRRFNGPVELKDALLQRKEDFVRGFVEQLLSFALGRKLEYFDHAAVNRILANSAPSYRYSQIIVEVTRSFPFQWTRSQEAIQ